MDDVAQAAGVSKSTVSYVLSGKKSISDEVVAAVHTAIDSLGYTPRISTPKLSKKLKVLSFCIPLHRERDFSQDSYFLPLLDGAYSAAVQAGYELCINPVAIESPVTLDQFFNDLPLFDGIILANLQASHLFREAIHSAGIPYVLNGTPEPDERDSSFYVDVDIVGAAYQASRLLAAKGHKNIYYLEMMDELVQSHGHIEGYKIAHKEADLPWIDANLAHARVNMDECQKLVEGLLSERNDITAFVAANDIMARGVLFALMNAGIPVPGKKAVVGMGGSMTSYNSIPRLTTVDYQPYMNGQTAVKMLIDIIERRRIQPSHVLIPGQLIERDTV